MTARAATTHSIRAHSSLDALADGRSRRALAAPDGYQMRYCTKSAGCTAGVDSKDWARMRTVTTEVSLPNQARLFY